MAMARHLVNKGFSCRAFVFFPETECKKELLNQITMAKSFGVSVNFIDSLFQLSSYLDEVGAVTVIDLSLIHI